MGVWRGGGEVQRVSGWEVVAWRTDGQGLTAIKLDGQLLSAPSDYTVSETGLVSFTVPPASKSIMTWSGAFYYRCRFAEDTADFARTLPNLWELRELAFIGAPGNRI